ncbi:radical SAM protein [Candidatus Woesearchaeota archaeon]|nr:radical SAM protein [Candidatus Woesearchaeota archaeon]
MNYTILDCYTDEPAGLGVPPYIGTYPRYIYGRLKKKGNDVKYITIDDVRLYKKYDNQIPTITEKQRSKIDVYNLTKNSKTIKEVLDKTEVLVVILGVHTPGKYLSAIPGTLREIVPLIEDSRCEKILTGPAASHHGTQLEGGKLVENQDTDIFDTVDVDYFEISSFEDIDKVAPAGAQIVKQILDIRVAEIETASGCFRDKGCSFCVEWTKPQLYREQKNIHEEVKALVNTGVSRFRLGKQTCFYSYKDGKTEEIKKLLEPISNSKPDVLHIDNANPARVNEEITKLIVKYCTPGNIAAFGVESFDDTVVKKNNLNSTPETTMKAIKIINKIGGKRSSNGFHHFLPGVNILFGLNGETKQTHVENMKYLHQILDEKLLLRRINIRQVVPYKGTTLYENVGNKFLRKNKTLYWKWRNQIRQEIDYEMLKRLVPENTIIKNVFSEVYDGKNTFLRQFGTYPLIVGIKQRLELKKFYNIKVTGHMLRSVVGKVV